MSTETDAALVERFRLRSLVEACLIVEEGVAATKDVDIGMTGGAGLAQGPFAAADEQGLDAVLDALERAEASWGEDFSPPLLLRRLVAQGRLGRSTGQGFFPYPRPDEGHAGENVLLETRGPVAIAWLARPPANPLSPALLRDLAELWRAVEGRVRVLVIASSSPAVFCAGADIREFTKMDRTAARELMDVAHGLLRDMERSSTVTIAAVNSLAYGGGCELAMGCDLRIAAESATFGQPEIGLGIIPGFGGTQRLPRLVGPARALEMNLTGQPVGAWEAFRIGLVNRVAPDHELLDTALGWAAKLAQQAPLSVAQIKAVSHAADLDEGIELEKRGFLEAFASDDAREGVAAFLEKRQARFSGS